MSLCLRNLQPSGGKIEIIEKEPEVIRSRFIREMKIKELFNFSGVNRSLAGGIKKGKREKTIQTVGTTCAKALSWGSSKLLDLVIALIEVRGRRGY